MRNLITAVVVMAITSGCAHMHTHSSVMPITDLNATVFTDTVVEGSTIYKLTCTKVVLDGSSQAYSCHKQLHPDHNQNLPALPELVSVDIDVAKHHTAKALRDKVNQQGMELSLCLQQMRGAKEGQCNGGQARLTMQLLATIKEAKKFIADCDGQPMCTTLGISITKMDTLIPPMMQQGG